MGRYLGLDSSTQSLSAVVIDTDSEMVVLNASVNFGQDLPQFHAPSGFLSHPDPKVKHSDPAMWLEALDLLFTKCKESGFDWGTIHSIGGSGQQHGSVYLNDSWFKALRRLDPAQDLKSQLAPCFSRRTAPIWMDSSTAQECAEIAAAIGGDAVVTRKTGSKTILRFTGPQIRKFYKTEPDAYAQTARIHLVSSFIPSVLAGTDAPIDFGDGAGMNLMNLAEGCWDQALLKATAPELQSKLPSVQPSSTKVGELCAYFVKKYGFKTGTQVLAFSGDNPCSLVGMGATQPGTIVISLGTSDTFFGAMSQPHTDPRGYGHVFGNPAGGFMSLICFTNGSLAREAVAQKVGLDWAGFEDAILRKTVPGNDGNMLLPYFHPETVPLIEQPQVKCYGSEAFCNWQAPAAAARAIVEAQALSMMLHSDWIGEIPQTVLVTGGASRNAGILQVLADVSGATLKRFSVSNAAALGAALRAANGIAQLSWLDLFRIFARPEPGFAVLPRHNLKNLYQEMRGLYAERLVETFGVPAYSQ